MVLEEILNTKHVYAHTRMNASVCVYLCVSESVEVRRQLTKVGCLLLRGSLG